MNDRIAFKLLLIKHYVESIRFYQISAVSTFLLFASSIFLPVAEITVSLLDPDAAQTLEFICVWCQYGNVDGEANGIFAKLLFTPMYFYSTWLISLFLSIASGIAMLKGFDRLKWSSKISASLAIKLSWIAAVVAILYRGFISLLIVDKTDFVRALYPDNQVIGESGWAVGGIVIGAILAAATAMIGYIEFLYDDTGIVDK